MADKDKVSLKKIVGNLDNNRKNVEAGLDVPDNIKSARKNFGELESVIKGQTGTISTLKAFEKTMNSDNTRNLETKRFFLSFVEKFRE